MAKNRGEFTVRVSPADVGKRLDTVIADNIPECSRSYASHLINQGNIQVQGINKKPGYRVKTSDIISALIPAPTPISFHPEPMDMEIIFEDDDLIVINKPAGLVVHPAPGHESGTLVNGLLYHCPDLKGIGGEIRPGIVHRLDKDTSGAIIVAKHADALHHLAGQFKSRKVEKTYFAIVRGKLSTKTGRISLPIGRHPVDRKRMTAAGSGRGRHREAETRWKILEEFEAATLLKLNPLTGRTHQIRVHCAAIRHPIIGDSVYGGRNGLKDIRTGKGHPLQVESVKRQMLHAGKIEIIHPASEKPVAFEAPLPPDMTHLIQALRAETARM